MNFKTFARQHGLEKTKTNLKSVKMAGNDGFFQNLSELISKIEQDSLTEDELVCVVEDFENYINQLITASRTVRYKKR